MTTLQNFWNNRSKRLRRMKHAAFHAMVVQAVLSGQHAEAWGATDMREFDQFLLNKLRFMDGRAAYGTVTKQGVVVQALPRAVLHRRWRIPLAASITRV